MASDPIRETTVGRIAFGPASGGYRPAEDIAADLLAGRIRIGRDPVTALVKLRAEMARLAHEVEALKGGEDIARRMRDVAMSTEMQEASKR